MDSPPLSAQNPARWRRIVGWVAVVLNAATACLWAYWGGIEAFHEGWWHETWLSNVGWTFAYLAPAASFVTLGLVGIRWPRVGAMVILAFTIWFWWWWDVKGKLAHGNVLVGLVMTGASGLLMSLWWCGRATPRRCAMFVTACAPTLVALASGAYPAYLVATRVDDGERGERTIVGHGVTLTWAPQGPGWARGASWDIAVHVAEHLSRNGSTVEATPQGYWRLPTMDEAARSLVRHGQNAGGVWDAAAKRVTYRVQPDKETPLWDPRSEVIYWWTADAAGDRRAWSIAYNGRTLARGKDACMGTIGFRLVRRE